MAKHAGAGRQKLAVLSIAAAAFLMAKPVAGSEETTAVLTLSCDGKMRALGSEEEETITNWGVEVNLPEGTVSGFVGIVARITRMDAAGMSFEGRGDLSVPGGGGPASGQITLFGEIDRLTGAVSATTMTKAATTYYELLCKPVKRMF